MEQHSERILSCGHRAHIHGVQARGAREPFALPGTIARFAPDRTADVRHTRLELVLDPERRHLGGIARHTLAALDGDVTSVTLHADELEVRSVTDPEGKALDFTHQGGRLVLTLARPLALGEETTVSVAYEGAPRRGLYFIQPEPAYPHKPFQVWSQGQDEDSRYWFPCFDHPCEKASSELLARVPARYRVISNGALVGKEAHEDGTVTWHWRQALPHSAYLVTLVVGEFDEVVLRPGPVPLTAYVPPGKASRAAIVFGRTAKMMEVFERRFGVSFPWEKYAQVVVEDFIFGGMENTSATTLVDLALYDERAALDYDADDLIAHELAHQWWGDLLTCRDWSHAWLNEGFATWCETVFKEEHLGHDEAAYERHTQRATYLDEDAAEYRRAIVDRRYAEPIDLFDRHLYEKGACVLHMLRKELGEGPFWRSIRAYATGNRGRSVVTEDLVRAVESATGRNLEWFFEQWIFRGGHPDLTFAWAHDAKKKDLALTIRQSQTADELTPEAFRFTAEVEVLWKGGRSRRHRLEVTRRDHTVHLPCDEAPERVRFDPDGDLLCTLEPGGAPDSQRAALAHDPAVIARLRAAAALAKDATQASADALERALHDGFWGVAAEAASALARMRTTAARDALVGGLASVKHPKARRAVAGALGAYRGDLVAAGALRSLLAKGDPSLFVESSTAAALGATRAPFALEVLERALASKDSWADLIRLGCIRGLALLGQAEAVPVLRERLERGHPPRVRAAAAGALAVLGRRLGNRDAVREALVDLLTDASFPVVMAAIGALRTLGDDRAIGALYGLADSGSDGRIRRAAQVAAQRIGKGLERTREVAKLSDDLEQVRKTNHDLLSRLERLETKWGGAPKNGGPDGSRKGKAAAAKTGRRHAGVRARPSAKPVAKARAASRRKSR
jgi:aminopeptidase N